MRIVQFLLLICVSALSGVQTKPYSPEEIQKFIAEHLDNVTDSDEFRIEFINGSIDCLECQSLPCLLYHYGEQTFQPEDIAFVGIFYEDEKMKGQYVTHDGRIYIADIQGNFTINGEYWQPSLIQRMVCIPNDEYVRPCFHHLRLRDGNVLSVMLKEPLTLTDGWSEKKIFPMQILKFSLDGGVYGSLRGKKKAICGDYIKEAELHYVDLQTMCNESIPISLIAEIQKDNCVLVTWVSHTNISHTN